MGTTANADSTTSGAPPSSDTTAVAQTDGAAAPPAPEEERVSQTALAVGSLPEKVKNFLIVRRQQNIVTAQIAGTNWGKGLDRDTRRAIADWSARAGIDPATELDVLGGRFYKNAQYYQRRLSELVEANKVVYAYLEHVEIDMRLQDLAEGTTNPAVAEEARRLIDHRAMMRIAYAIPDEAASAAVFHIMLTNVGHEFSAAKWCGGGTRKKDPVGDDFPVETCETRALRRGMRLIASQNPALKPLIEINDDDTIDAEIGETLREGLLRAKNDQIRAAAAAFPTPLLELAAGDPYNLDNTARAPRKASDPIETVERATLSPAIAANMKATEQTEPAAAPAAPADDFIDDTDLLTPEERAEHERKAK